MTLPDTYKGPLAYTGKAENQSQSQLSKVQLCQHYFSGVWRFDLWQWAVWLVISMTRLVSEHLLLA